MLGHGRAWRPLLVGLLALAVTLPLDTMVHDRVFRHVVSHELRLLANGVTVLGTGWAASGLLAGLVVGGVRTADHGLIRAGGGGLAGVALGSLLHLGAKHLACRGRPRLVDGWGVDAVGAPAPAGGGSAPGFFRWPCLGDARYQSFPSGHATTVFALAAALAYAAPARRRLWLAVAAGVAVSRVLLNAHFLSDVVGGAVLGWYAGQGGLLLAARVAAARPAPAATPGGSGGRPGTVSA